jgi:SAM-dependent methyltransferase
MEWTIGWWQVSVQRVYPTAMQLSQAYNHAAPWWHQHLRFLGYRYAYQELWRSIRAANILPHWKDKVTFCDCGIGTAALSLAFAQIVDPTVQITGVDLSAKMLNQSSQKLDQAGVLHQLYQSDVKTLPFADCVFDGVISAHMLEHLPEPVLGLQEMVRVLRPGAPLVLVVTRSGFLGAVIQWHWGNRCFSPEDLSKLMLEAGLTRIRFFSFPPGLARSTSVACIGFRSSSCF